MVPAALWMALTMLVSPEALPQEVVDEQARLDFGLASHPFTVQAMHPPKGRHLHPFDWIDTPARLLASRPDTANAWPVVVARLHMHLGPQRTRRPAFGASDGPGKDAFGLGPVGQEAAGLPAHSLLGMQSLTGRPRRGLDQHGRWVDRLVDIPELVWAVSCG
jgi:hypothetical protein